ncbi:hypothetical protein XELAEV_18011657mg [Xenopus laevis]|uniref:Uncharacterized protein n=1 Tax=Xenopus laevis TaxID=8355 RepID=A0A974HXI3_XENLA|nr:hypothetical protein XELAEV_18011657mg [Xenopus laevis]
MDGTKQHWSGGFSLNLLSSSKWYVSHRGHGTFKCSSVQTSGCQAPTYLLYSMHQGLILMSMKIWGRDCYLPNPNLLFHLFKHCFIIKCVKKCECAPSSSPMWLLYTAA